MKKSWLITCLINFFIAASMGVILRHVYVHPLSINYTYLIHGHSHTAMLGWIYLMLYSFIFHSFVSKEKPLEKKYSRLFWITQASVIGMIISFPIQGYGVVSIIFSTLHVFCSYYFCYSIWKDSKASFILEKKVLRAALLFMFSSTFGIWCLGFSAATAGKSSAFYQIAIQFFIHFQFNGWILFGVLAIFLHQFESSKFKLKNATFNWCFYSLIIATFLTFALPISWYLSHPALQWINRLGLFMQFFSFIYFFKLIQPYYKELTKQLKPITKWLYNFAFLFLFLKIGIQSITFLTEMASLSHDIRNFTIGFIHLSMLGLISGFLFAFISQLKLFNAKNIFSKAGIVIFLICFFITEVLLFAQGAFFYLGKGMIPNYNNLLFIFSVGLPAALLLLILSLFRYKKQVI